MSSKQYVMYGWQDFVELVIALWLCASPFFLGFYANANATASALLIGATVLLIAQLGLANEQPWEEWTNIALSTILILSPWLFGYSDIVPATVNVIVCSIFITGFAILSLQRDYRGMSDRHAAPT